MFQIMRLDFTGRKEWWKWLFLVIRNWNRGKMGLCGGGGFEILLLAVGVGRKC